MAQLVIQNNRVLAHGTDCFLCMGGTVVCTASGRVFEHASVVEVDCAVPSDIDNGGYEYKGGCFYPCSRVLPDTASTLGLNNGATVDDALNKMFKDGVKIETGSYVGTDGYASASDGVTLTFEDVPTYLIITGVSFVSPNATYEAQNTLVIDWQALVHHNTIGANLESNRKVICYLVNNNANYKSLRYELSNDHKTISFYTGNSSDVGYNKSWYTYFYTAIFA